MKKKNSAMAFVFARLLLIGALALVGAGAFAPAPAHADVHGITYGFVIATEPNFDGLGTCRLVLFYDRYSVVDFPGVDLAAVCEKSTPGVGQYLEAIVDDADLIPCTPTLCSPTSAMNHFIAAKVLTPTP